MQRQRANPKPLPVHLIRCHEGKIGSRSGCGKMFPKLFSTHRSEVTCQPCRQTVYFNSYHERHKP